MLSEKILDTLNDQLNYEQYSAHLYLAMAAYFDDIDLNGFSHWMQIQLQEETAHAMMFYAYIVDRGGRVVLKTIDSPQRAWESPLAAFADALAHEQKVTARINKLLDLALKEGDHATGNFLQWFVKEQVEEEAAVKAIIQHLKLIKGEGQGLFMINRELATRTFVPPNPQN